MTDKKLERRAKKLAAEIKAEMIKLGAKAKGDGVVVDGYFRSWPAVREGHTEWSFRGTGRLCVEIPCVTGTRYKSAHERRQNEPKNGFVASKVALLAYGGMRACAALLRANDAQETARIRYENARDSLLKQLEPLREKFHGYTIDVTGSLRVSVSTTFATVEAAKQFLEKCEGA
jgi:hypothetical protein